MFVINKSYIFVVKLSKTLVVKIFKYERIGLFEDWKRLQVNPIFSSYCVYIFERKLMGKELFVSSIPGKIGLCYKILILGHIILTC